MDPDRWIFLEPMAAGANQGLRSRLPRLRDPRAGEQRLVYFPHVYTLDLDLRGRCLGIPVLVGRWARIRAEEARRCETPLLVGEFDLDATRPGALGYVRAVLDAMERVGSGSTYWSYAPGPWGISYGPGQEQPLADALVRAYPRAIAGPGAFPEAPGAATLGREGR